MANRRHNAKDELPFVWSARSVCWRKSLFFLRLYRVVSVLSRLFCSILRVGADTAVFIHSGFSWFFVSLFYFCFGSICLYFLSAHWLRRCAMNAYVCAVVLHRHLISLFISALWRRFGRPAHVCANEVHQPTRHEEKK